MRLDLFKNFGVHTPRRRESERVNSVTNKFDRNARDAVGVNRQIVEISGSTPFESRLRVPSQVYNGAHFPQPYLLLIMSPIPATINMTQSWATWVSLRLTADIHLTLMLGTLASVPDCNFQRRQLRLPMQPGRWCGISINLPDLVDYWREETGATDPSYALSGFDHIIFYASQKARGAFLFDEEPTPANAFAPIGGLGGPFQYAERWTDAGEWFKLNRQTVIEAKQAKQAIGPCVLNASEDLLPKTVSKATDVPASVPTKVGIRPTRIATQATSIRRPMDPRPPGRQATVSKPPPQAIPVQNMQVLELQPEPEAEMEAEPEVQMSGLEAPPDQRLVEELSGVTASFADITDDALGRVTAHQSEVEGAEKSMEDISSEESVVAPEPPAEAPPLAEETTALLDSLVRPRSEAPQLELGAIIGTSLEVVPPILWLAVPAAPTVREVAPPDRAALNLLSAGAQAVAVPVGGDVVILPDNLDRNEAAYAEAVRGDRTALASIAGRVRIIHAHESSLVAMASCYGRGLLASATKNEVRLWAPDHGFLLGQPVLPDNLCVHSLALSDRGERLAALCTDQVHRTVVVTWQLAPLWSVQHSADLFPSLPVEAVTALSSMPELSTPTQIVFDPCDAARFVTLSSTALLAWRIVQTRQGVMFRHTVITLPVQRIQNILSGHQEGDKPDPQGRLLFTSATFVHMPPAGFPLDPTRVIGTTDHILFVGTTCGGLLRVNLSPDLLKRRGFNQCLESVYSPHESCERIGCVNTGAGLIASTSGQSARVWDDGLVGSHLLEASFENDVRFAQLAPDGQALAIALENGTIGVLDLVGGSFRTYLRSHTAPLLPTIVSQPNIRTPIGEPEGPPGLYPVLATAASDQTVRLWDPITVRQHTIFHLKDEKLVCTAFNQRIPDLAMAFDDSKLRILSAASLHLVATIDVPTPPTAVAYSPDGDLCAVATKSGTLFLLAASNCYAAIATIPQGADPDVPHSVCFTPDGWMAAVALGRRAVDLHKGLTGMAQGRQTQRMQLNLPAPETVLAISALGCDLLVLSEVVSVDSEEAEKEWRVSRFSLVDGSCVAQLRLGTPTDAGTQQPFLTVLGGDVFFCGAPDRPVLLAVALGLSAPPLAALTGAPCDHRGAVAAEFRFPVPVTGATIVQRDDGPSVAVVTQGSNVVTLLKPRGLC